MPDESEKNGDAVWDSGCWFPPLELAALVAAGVVKPRATILDVGCGYGIEAIFLAKLGWSAVYAFDRDHQYRQKAENLARANRAKVHFHFSDLAWGSEGLPQGWPRRYDVVLDRMCINNFCAALEESEDDPRAFYFSRIAQLLKPGGLLILRDRGDEEEREVHFRRKLLEPVDLADFLDKEGARLFRTLPGGRVLNVRLVGDDTDDKDRLDAMVPVRGILAILQRLPGAQDPRVGRRHRRNQRTR